MATDGGGGGMADTPDSKSGAERHEGSSPSPRTCECGFATNDPLHIPWHQITAWNAGVFDDARRKREAEFDKLLGHAPEKPKSKKREKRYVPLPGEATGP